MELQHSTLNFPNTWIIQMCFTNIYNWSILTWVPGLVIFYILLSFFSMPWITVREPQVLKLSPPSPPDVHGNTTVYYGSETPWFKVVSPDVHGNTTVYYGSETPGFKVVSPDVHGSETPWFIIHPWPPFGGNTVSSLCSSIHNKQWQWYKNKHRLI